MDYRRDVLRRLEALGKTTNWLAERLQGRVTRSALYAFLRAENPSQLGSDSLGLVDDELKKAEKAIAK